MACLKSKPQNIVQGVYDIYVNQPPVPLIRKKMPYRISLIQFAYDLSCNFLSSRW